MNGAAKETRAPQRPRPSLLAKLRKSARKQGARLACRLMGGRKILGLCDSHGGVLEYIHDHGLLRPHLINCEIVGGATAYGLNNDASITQAFNKFARTVGRFADYDTVLVMLGEVDCCVSMWNRAERRQEPVFEQIGPALAGIQRLVDWLRAQGKRDIVILGSILPTVADDERGLQLDAMRRAIGAGQRQRTELVLEFNARLRELAQRNGLPYIDVTAETVDRASGLVDPAYLIGGTVDHHLSQEKSAPLWAAQLRRVLES
jgi:hypothetical protein